MKAGIALAIVLGLSACKSDGAATASATSLEKIRPANYSTILPSNAPKIGALYFSGIGRRPRFALPDGTVFNELCYDDYIKTVALKDLAKQVIDDGIRIDSKTISSGLNGNASLSTPKIAQLASLTVGGKISRDATFQLTNVREISLTDEGAKIVRDNLGDNCRALIATMKKENKQVVLLLSGWRADRLTDTTASAHGGTLDVSVGGSAKADNAAVAVSGPGFRSGGDSVTSDSTTYSLVYLFINPDSESM